MYLHKNQFSDANRDLSLALENETDETERRTIASLLKKAHDGHKKDELAVSKQKTALKKAFSASDTSSSAISSNDRNSNKNKTGGHNFEQDETYSTNNNTFIQRVLYLIWLVWSCVKDFYKALLVYILKKFIVSFRCCLIILLYPVRKLREIIKYFENKNN